MITIQSSAEKAIKKNPYLKEILLSDYANISAIAKKIKKDVEKDLFKNISLNSLVVALNRIKKRLNKQINQTGKIFDVPPEITFKGGLIEIVFNSDEEIYKKLNNFAIKLTSKEEFFALSKGFYEITTILPKIYIHKLKKEGFMPKKIVTDLTLISIKLPPKVIDIPGVYYRILQFVAYENIPLIEIFSTYTELMLFVKQKYEAKLFESVRRLIKIL